MSRLDEVGERDGWRCWLCDEPVDRDASVTNTRGPSVDAVMSKAKSKAKGKTSGEVNERLAHRSCNTKKGAITPVAPWPEHLFVIDPAPIIDTVEALKRKPGRAVIARCPTQADGDEAAAWLKDRITRLSPGLSVETTLEPGGGQFMLVLRA